MNRKRLVRVESQRLHMPGFADLRERPHHAGVVKGATVVLTGADLGGFGRVDEGRVNSDVFGASCRTIHEAERNAIGVDLDTADLDGDGLGSGLFDCASDPCAVGSVELRGAVDDHLRGVDVV